MRRLASSLPLNELVCRVCGGSGTVQRPLTGRWSKRTSAILPARRHFSSPGFYDPDILVYASRPPHPLTLKELLRFGKPPVTSEKLIESSRYVRSELPIRLARRVCALQNLPFIVGMNPHVRAVYQLYHDSFQKMKSIPEIQDKEGEENFTELLAFLVDSHTNVIPQLAKGFKEAARYMSKSDITAFLDNMIQARIGIRLIAEQHLALHLDLGDHMFGVVNATVKPVAIIRSCGDLVCELCDVNYGSAPELEVDGHVDMSFAYIPVHLEYMIMELLKNAFRATVEQSGRTHRFPHPPVQVTVSKGDSDIAIRIRDEGGGVPPSDLLRIWDYSYTTVSDDAEAGAAPDELDNIFASQSQFAMQMAVGGPIAGLGFGLPLTRMYARYFGGSIDLVSLHGYGTDVFLSLPNLDLSRELTPVVD